MNCGRNWIVQEDEFRIYKVSDVTSISRCSFVMGMIVGAAIVGGIWLLV